jgi:outer membrane immunogenic protein
MKCWSLFALLLSGLLLLAGPSFASTDEMATVLRRLDALENNNATLKKEITVLQKENVVLQDRARRLKSREGVAVSAIPVSARANAGLAASNSAVVGAGASSYASATLPGTMYNWTGLYLGAHFGAGWGTDAALNVQGGGNPGTEAGSGTTNGVLGGGQIGYNYQFGRALVGIEGEYTAAAVKGDTHLKVGDDGTSHSAVTVQNRRIATIAGRVGAVFQDNMLLYVKGGSAWVQSTFDVTRWQFGLVGSAPTINDNRSGYVVGFGTEYKFDRNWSAKIEYNYLDFGTKTLTQESIMGSGPRTADVSNQVHTVKVGANYTFN